MKRKQDTESDYKPKTVVSKPRKCSRARRQIEQVDYSEAEIILDTESETTNSREGTLVVDSPERGETQLKGETDWELSNLWTPDTLDTRTRLVSEQYSRLTER